jgi:hypothetical protein
MGICTSRPSDEQYEEVIFTAKIFKKQQTETAELRTLIKESPDFFPFCRDLALSLEAEALLWMHPRNPNPDFDKARDMLEEALLYINRCIEIPKEQWRLYTLDWLEYHIRGDIYMALGRYEEALKDFEYAMKMAKIEGDTSECSVNLQKAMQKSSTEALEKIKWLAGADLEAVGGAEEVMEEAQKLNDERCELISKSIQIIKAGDNKHTASLAELNRAIEVKGEEIYACQAKIQTVRTMTLEPLYGSFKEYDARSNDEAFTKYRNGFVATWTEVYSISLSVKGGAVLLDTSNIAVDAVAGLCSLFPWGGNVIGSGIKVVYKEIETAQMKQKANTFLKVARDSSTLDKISNHLALKLAISNKDEILHPKKQEIEGWFKGFIAKVKEVAHDASVKVYGERFEYVEEQLGNKHAQSIIAYLSSGKFAFYPEKTLISRLEETFAIGQAHGFEEIPE